MPRNTRSSWGSNKPARRKGHRTLRYWADLHDGRGYMRHTKTIEGSKRDGDMELARLRIEHSGDVAAPTLRECYERWYLPDIEERLAHGTKKIYKSTWRSKIEPRFGDSHVTDIRPIDIQEWLSGMTKSQSSLAVKVLAAILDYPLRYELIDRNPARTKMRLPKAHGTRDKGTYTFSDAMRIFEACEGSYCEAAILSSLFGSCRVGESLSPMAVEVVEDRSSSGVVAARFDLVRQMANERRIREGLKTDSSARTIVFVGRVAERMLEIRDERISCGLTWMTDNGLGEPVIQDRLNREWRRVCDESGIEHHPFMNLRNSWRTFMSWELGVDDSRLERLMGHAGKDVTSKHYDRPSVQMLIDAVADAYERNGVLV